MVLPLDMHNDGHGWVRGGDPCQSNVGVAPDRVAKEGTKIISSCGEPRAREERLREPPHQECHHLVLLLPCLYSLLSTINFLVSETKTFLNAVGGRSKILPADNLWAETSPGSTNERKERPRHERQLQSFHRVLMSCSHRGAGLKWSACPHLNIYYASPALSYMQRRAGLV